MVGSSPGERGDEQAADDGDAGDDRDADDAVFGDLVFDYVHERDGLTAVRGNLEKLVQALTAGDDVFQPVVTQSHIVETVTVSVAVLQKALHHYHTFSDVRSLWQLEWLEERPEVGVEGQHMI